MNDIILPKELAESSLTLKEIGAIVVLYSLTKINEESRALWSALPELIETGESLVERGIINFSKNDEDENIMEIDLRN